MNFCDNEYRHLKKEFIQMHEGIWEEDVAINEIFILHKSHVSLLEMQWQQRFDVVYFDAFDPGIQPELWTEKVFGKIFNLMNQGGILVTYSSKGDVRRAMISAGFMVEKIPGAKGKREMIRAHKP